MIMTVQQTVPIVTQGSLQKAWRIGSMHTSANYNVSVQSSERGSLGCKPL